MDNRKQKILQAIVKDYIFYGEPIGSRTIARKFDLGLSPATIRNEMSDLEEMGYLIQPHTSAGRIPNDKGYRYYVNWLIESGSLFSEQEIFDRLSEHFELYDNVTQEVARFITDNTHYPTVLITSQKHHFPPIRHVRLFAMEGNKVMMVVIGENEDVSHQLIELDRYLSEQELDHISKILSYHLRDGNTRALTVS